MTTQVTPGTITSGTMTTKVNGRSYSCAAGAAISVPDFDAALLEANGWLANAADVTANRPNPGKPGQIFLDTTLGYLIKCDAKGQWHNMATGAVV